MARSKSSDNGDMSVSEAGQRGGKATSQKYDHEHFVDIGEKGGGRVSELVDKGKQAEGSDE